MIVIHRMNYVNYVEYIAYRSVAVVQSCGVHMWCALAILRFALLCCFAVCCTVLCFALLCCAKLCCCLVSRRQQFILR